MGNGHEQRALVVIGTMWSGGWQPVELARQMVRASNPAVGRLALVAIAADHHRRPTATLDPRWISQLDRLDLPRVESSIGWLEAWAAREQVPWPDAVEAIVTLLGCLAVLSRLPILIPPRAREQSPTPTSTSGRQRTIRCSTACARSSPKPSPRRSTPRPKPSPPRRRSS